MQKRVSVLVTVFNEEDYVQSMIDSLARQTYQNLELVIVNDGSTDSTQALLASIAKNHTWVKVINLAGNHGKAFAQNVAYRSASGSYIALHGGDDISHPSRISAQLTFMAQNRLDASITQMKLIDSDGRVTRSAFMAPPNLVSCPVCLLRGSSFPAGTLVFTRSLAQSIYPIPEKLPYEDRWITFRIQRSVRRIGFLAEPLYAYRQHTTNTYPLKSTNSVLKNMGGYKKTFARDLIVDREISYSLFEDCQYRNNSLFVLQKYIRARVSGELALIESLSRKDFYLCLYKAKANERLALLFPAFFLFIKAFRYKMKKRKPEDKSKLADVILVVNDHKNCNCSTRGDTK